MIKNKRKKFSGWVLLLSAAVLLSACAPAAPAEPTTDPSMVFTQVAQTVEVSMTQTAQAMPPTATPEPTATLEPLETATPTLDPSLPTYTPMATLALGPTATTQIIGDAAKWNTQSPMDGKVFKVNEEFTFHVCMGNIGNTEWTTGYYLAYVDGQSLSWMTKANIGKKVKPSEKWCFDIPCTAPAVAGNYSTYWWLRNAEASKMLGGEVYFTYKVQN